MYPERILKALQRAKANLNAGNPAGAVQDLEKVIQKMPKAFDGWHLMGNAKCMMRDYVGAEACFKKAIGIQPRNSETWLNLGITYSARNMYETAIPAYQRAISFSSGPPHPDIVHNLGSCYLQLDRYDDAISVFNELVFLRDVPDSWALLGVAFQGADRYPEALSAYLRCVERGGGGYTIFLNLGTCYDQLKDPDNAAKYAQMALECKPDDDVAFYNLACAHIAAGRFEEAIQAYDRSNLQVARLSRAMVSNYLDPLDPFEVRRQHELAAASLVPRTPVPFQPVSLDKGERLRLGFVSHDFREHPVAFFLDGLLGHLDRTRYEIYLYSDVSKEDEVTARFKAMGHHWRAIFGVSNEDFAARVKTDRIHVLIDLGGYTNSDRLAAFGNRLAPVQATYLGYSATTGLNTVDYLLADEIIAPAGQCENHYTEQVIRLGRIFASYTPPLKDVPVSPAPALAKGYPTFGSFAKLYKISASSVRLWISALQAVPNSRMLVMSQGLGTPAAKERFLAPFLAAGIDSNRFDLRESGSLDEYLAAHDQVDLILDTTPWNGHTTTLHGLWMGVPTVTVRGNSHTSRFGEMVLGAAGLSACIVDDPADFGGKVAELVSNGQQGLPARQGLRHVLLNSELCDHAAMARRFEEACDRMWESYVATSEQTS